MGFKTKSPGINTRTYFDMRVTEAVVTNAKVITDKLITFTLKCHGFSLYGMKLVEGKDGKRFITPPSVKGLNGTYYNQYALYLTEEDQNALIDSVLIQAGVKNAD